MLRLVKIILIVAIGLLLGYILFSKPSSQKVLDTKEYTEKIDSLESEISIIRTKKDSINRVIDLTDMFPNTRAARWQFY